MSLVTFADSGNLDKQPEVKGADLCITASYGSQLLTNTSRTECFNCFDWITNLGFKFYGPFVSSCDIFPLMLIATPVGCIPTFTETATSFGQCLLLQDNG